jgi:acetyl esterase/lipase
MLLLIAVLTSLLCPAVAQGAVAAHRDIVYRDLPGVDSKLVSLDVYTPDPIPAHPLPVVIYVHGGAWYMGDKSDQMQYKPALFTGAGYCFASVNYRLSPCPVDLKNPKRVMYPAPEQDVAAAVAWVHTHIGEYGGDPARIALIGSSAGAHLVNLISTDESFLAKYDLKLSALRGVIVLDSAGYDIADKAAPNRVPLFRNAFGTDPEVWANASPIKHVAPGKGIPPMLLVTRGFPWHVAECEQYAKAMTDAGIKATVVNAAGYNHPQVNARVGEPGETIVTPAVMPFLSQVL